MARGGTDRQDPSCECRCSMVATVRAHPGVCESTGSDFAAEAKAPSSLHAMIQVYHHALSNPATDSPLPAHIGTLDPTRTEAICVWKLACDCAHRLGGTGLRWYCTLRLRDRGRSRARSAGRGCNTYAVQGTIRERFYSQ